MSDLLLPILVFTVPVLGIVFLAMSGRKLSGSCGGVGPNGNCSRCGRSSAQMPPPGQHDRCPSSGSGT